MQTSLLIIFYSGIIFLARGQETKSKLIPLKSIEPILILTDTFSLPPLQNFFAPKFHPCSKNMNTSISRRQFTTETTKRSIFERSKPYAAPVVLMSLSFYSLSGAARGSLFDKYRIHEKILAKVPHDKRTNIDNCTQSAPLAITAALKLLGVQSKNDLLNSSILALKSFMISTSISRLIKYTVPMTRPSGNDTESFPSGHTVVAFTAATIMHLEFKDTSPWYSVLGYSIATATGAMRMTNNKHWLPDVLAGASIGIASTQLVYATHKYRWGKIPQNFVFIPTFSPKHFGAILTYTF